MRSRSASPLASTAVIVSTLAAMISSARPPLENCRARRCVRDAPEDITERDRFPPRASAGARRSAALLLKFARRQRCPMNQERIVQVFFFGFLALITWELYQVFEPFLMPIAWAILLAFLAHPALIELDRHLHSRTTSALLITIIVALGVVLPAVWLSERL